MEKCAKSLHQGFSEALQILGLQVLMHSGTSPGSRVSAVSEHPHRILLYVSKPQISPI